MTHPTDIPTFQAALGALSLDDVPDDKEAAIADAQAARSVVSQCGAVMDALASGVADLSLNAARVLAGASHLVLNSGFLGRAEEADTVRDAARARIAALEA